MKRRAFQLGCMSAVLGVLIMTGCSTHNYSVRRKAPDADQYQYTVNVTYLTEEALIERFSEKNNPFLSPQGFVKGNLITAFDVVIENNSSKNKSIQIAIETITLYSGTKTFTARNQFKLSQFWDSRLSGSDRGRQYKGSNASKMRYVIGQFMFENTTTIESGQQKKGILVFQGNIQKWGEVEVHIPLFTGEEEYIEEYVYTHEF